MSPPGNLYAALSWPADAGALGSAAPVVVGACLADALYARGFAARVKWPNDLLVDGAKVGGILLEERGGAVVAGVGWIDDRTPLKARYRLVAHVLAAGWALFAFGGMPSVAFGDAALSLGRWGTLFALCGGVWAINLYNFMDGIDGLAAGEAFLVAGAAALLLVREHAAVSFALFALAACVSGFL